ncbi:MAG TPA: hypothetical protein VFG68_13795 [Fimbriiglobus sp.]|nr:hypothetical protein [Fimbriiglobus sp.]
MTGSTVSTGGRVRQRVRLFLHVVPRSTAAAPRPWARPTRRKAGRAALWFLAFAVVMNVGFLLALDYGPPRLRDPEYGKRLARVRARVAEYPGRPLVLAIGSSRTAMGVRPGVLASEPSGPLVLNFALVGSGPIMELMAFRRALADGVKPAAVLIEYWPAFLHEGGPYHEQLRLDVSRLRPVDRAIVRDFFRDPAAAQKTMREQRLNPWYGHRRSLLNQLAPSLLLKGQRSESMWDHIDDWGWLPGRTGATAEQIEKGRASTAAYYVPLFATFEVSPVADRALRQLVAECRVNGIPVALLYLPEGAVFRSFMTPASVRLSDEHLRRVVGELKLPLIDARGWVPDADMLDGFHLTQDGAAKFTRKLHTAVTATFPELK